MTSRGRLLLQAPILAAVFITLLPNAATRNACRADEPERSTRPDEAKREDLRYQGRDFNQWRREFQTELAPDARIKAIEALARFGRHGYAEEAAAAIAEGLHDDENKVIAAAAEALARLKPIAGRHLKGLFAVCVEFERNAHDESNRLLDYETIMAIRGAIVAMGVEAAPILIDALSSNEEATSVAALYILADLGPKAEPAVDALARAADDENDTVRWMAIDTLAKIGGGAKRSVPALLKALRSGDQGVLCSAAVALWMIAPDDEDVIVALKDAMKHDTAGIRDSLLSAIAPIVTRGIVYADQTFDPGDRVLSESATVNPAHAATLLTEMLRPSDPNQGPEDVINASYYCEIIDLLGDLGPVAKEAVPMLKTIATKNRIYQQRGRKAIDVAQHARDALSKIEADTKTERR